MPDIELRFNKDMLVLSAPIDAMLARQGIDSSRDRQYLNLMEPDVIHDALNLEVVAGANCLVTTTEDITQARLAHVRMDGDAARLAGAAFSIASELKPHHVLAEIGPCDLPLDASSKASLNEHRGQYDLPCDGKVAVGYADRVLEKDYVLRVYGIAPGHQLPVLPPRDEEAEGPAEQECDPGLREKAPERQYEQREGSRVQRYQPAVGQQKLQQRDLVVTRAEVHVHQPHACAGGREKYERRK